MQTISEEYNELMPVISKSGMGMWMFDIQRFYKPDTLNSQGHVHCFLGYSHYAVILTKYH